MLLRSRQVLATVAVSALLAGGAVAHAATGSSGSATSSTSTTPAAAMDSYAVTHSSSDCPDMGGDSTPSTTPSTTPSSGSGTPTSTTAV
jgi:hypothetical protein